VKLLLQRALRGQRMELGLLYVDRRPECLVEMLGSEAIESGRYRVEIRADAAFRRPLPVLFDAHGFERLRFVPGGELNAWLPGCLVPVTELPAGGGIGRTRQAFDSLLAQIQAALTLGERVRLRIV
jgi:hypothetical protein